MNYLDATKNYYAEWLAVNPELLKQDGTFLSYSPNRDLIQEGYNRAFDLYVYLSGQTLIITYGRRLEQNIAWFRESFEKNNDIAELKHIVFERFGKELHHDFKYYFHSLPTDNNHLEAKQLAIKDFPDFFRFYKTLFPNCEAETWLDEYFAKIVAKGDVFGCYVDEKLVCVSDSPDMPYMKECTVELGINTLPEYRKRGYAKTVLGAMVKYVIDNQKIPIASCTSSNIASQKLLKNTGFEKLADVLTLSLGETCCT